MAPLPRDGPRAMMRAVQFRLDISLRSRGGGR